MYTLNFIDEYGHVYTKYGLLESFQTKNDFKEYKFKDLAQAIRYAKAFIRRYPQAHAQISKKNEIIETLQNDKYWEFKENKDAQWKDTHRQMSKLTRTITYILVTIVSILFVLEVHYLGVYGFSLYTKLLLAPVSIILLYFFSNKFITIVLK